MTLSQGHLRCAEADAIDAGDIVRWHGGLHGLLLVHAVPGHQACAAAAQEGAATGQALLEGHPFCCSSVMALRTGPEADMQQIIAQAQQHVALACHSGRQIMAALGSEDEPAAMAKKVSSGPLHCVT